LDSENKCGLQKLAGTADRTLNKPVPLAETQAIPPYHIRETPVNPTAMVTANTEVITMNNRLIKINELAEAIGFSVPWIYARTRLNLIPCVRVGRNLRFDLKAVLNWLETGNTSLTQERGDN
jgi:predicted DNA-binding transcriptional regulator AlpA